MPVSEPDIIALSLQAAKEQIERAAEHYAHDEIAMAGQDAHSALDDLRMAVRRIEEKRKDQKRLERAVKSRERRGT